MERLTKEGSLRINEVWEGEEKGRAPLKLRVRIRWIVYRRAYRVLGWVPFWPRLSSILWP